MLIVILSTFIVVLLSFLYIKKTYRIKKVMARIPGPKPLPVLGNTLQFGTEPDELFKSLIDLHKTYGPVTSFWLGTQPMVLISGVEDIEVILSSNKLLTKSYVYDFFDKWLGLNLLTSTGDVWFRKRKLITPAFHFQILEQFIDVFNNNVSILIKNLENEVDKPGFNVVEYVNLCTLDIIAESSMGVTINAQKNASSPFVQGIHAVAFTIIYRMFKPWLHSNMIFDLLPIGRKYNKDLQTIQDFVDEVIRNRKQKRSSNKNGNIENESDIPGKKKRAAFLDLLLDASDSGRNLTDQDIKDEVNAFMFAGHDTTTGALSFTLYALMKHQDVQENVVKEMNEIFGNSDRVPTYRDLQEMKYLENVIKESMRMWPPVPYTGRSITEDTHLKSGYILPKGVATILFIHQLHCDPKLFPNPEVFNPERFNFENSEGRNPFAFCPFSAGPRNCIGQRFATLELKTILSSIVRKYKILPPIGLPDINEAMELVLRSTTGVNIRLVNRSK